MTCDFTSILTVFQSYQDDGKLIMIYYVSSIYGWEEFHLQLDSDLEELISKNVIC